VQQFAVLLCLLLPLLQSTTIQASSTFLGRIPPMRYEPTNSSSRRGHDSSDGASSDDGGDFDEIESSSEDESLWGSPLPTRASPIDSPSLAAAAQTKAARSSPRQSDPSSASIHQGSSHPVKEAGAPMNYTATVAHPHPTGPSQSLQTLQKLQNMLDETDYLTTSRRKQQPTLGSPAAIGSPAATGSVSESNVSVATSSADSGRLWTSKDRAKYKKQQHKIRKQQEELLLLQKSKDDTPRSTPFQAQQSSPPIHPFSDDEQEQQSDDFDDGLGVSLPNVPVYYSDAEGDSDPGTDAPPSTAPLPSTFQPREMRLQQEPSPGSTMGSRNHSESAQYQPPPPPIDLNYYDPQRIPPPSSHQTFGPLPQGERVPQQQFYPPYPPFHPNGLPYMYPPSHYGPYMHPPAYHGQFGSWSPALPPPPGFAQQARAAYPAGVATPRQYSARGVMQPPPPPPPPQPRPTSSVETGAQAVNVTSFIDARNDPASTAESSTNRDVSTPSYQHSHKETAVSFVDRRMNYYGMAPAYFIAPENVRAFDAEGSCSCSLLTSYLIFSLSLSRKQAPT
jgi:hypothetical protein